ncbi:MAG TPA: response regulator [Saprospiraceae bacterium]|nr:response regulator [Saprospiraceae bacterium]
METIKKIFLIDDDKIFNFINSKIISKTFSSINVVAFDNPQIALIELIRITEVNIDDFPDVIFLDINMPEMDGWEFLEELNKFEANIFIKSKIIMLTSSIDPNDIQKSKTYKMVNGFISKPLSAEKLLQCLSD